MKKNFIDSILKVLLGIGIIFITYGFLIEDNNLIRISFVFLLFISLFILVYLIKNKVLFRKKDFLKFSLDFRCFDDVYNFVHKKLINDNYLVYKNNDKVYLKIINKDSVIVFKILNDINYKEENIFIKEDIKYMYSVSILVVSELDKKLYKKLSVKFYENKAVLLVIYSLEDKNLYMFNYEKAEEIIKYNELKNVLLEVFEITED